MQAIRRLIVEAHRRSLWQVFTIYVAVAWGGYQIISALPTLIGVPDWVPGMSLVLFLIGLPIVVATAFVQEGGPTRGERAIADAASAAPSGAGNESNVGLATSRTDAPLVPEAIQPSSVASPALARRLFTWKRSLAGAGLALLLLTTSAAGYMGMRAAGWGPAGSLRASGELAADDVLILADFGNSTTDAALGDVITEALRIDLSSSRGLKLAEPAQIEAALGRMQRDSVTIITGELALEIAQREQLKAVVAGEVGALGRSYVLTAEIFATSDRRVIAQFRETARNADELLDATDRLARAIRTKAGESLRSINNTPPLEHVTTRSLAALRKYTEAIRASGSQQRVELLQEAIALDSTFAMAYRLLASTYANRLQRKASTDARIKAFELRHNMTAVERALTEADYYRAVERNRERALRSYREALAIDPQLTAALNNAALLLNEMQRFAEAESLAMRGIDRPGVPAVRFSNLINAQTGQGKNAEALATAKLFEERYPQNIIPTYVRFLHALNNGAAARADSIALDAQQRESPNFELEALAALSRGQLAKVAELQQRNRARTIARGGTPGLPSAQVLLESVRHGLDGAPARRTLDSIAAVWESRTTAPVLDRPLETLAYVYAVLGNLRRAKHYVALAEARLREEVGANPFTWTLPAARARVALAEGNPDAALQALRAADPPCDICIDYEAANVFDAIGQPDSAIARYRRFVTEPRSDEYRMVIANRALVTLRLAELYDAHGDRANAAEFYTRLITAWEHADPHLQPRVAAARARLAQLRTER